MSGSKQSSLLNSFTRRDRIGRQRERTQIEGRRVAVAPKAVVENQKFGVVHALAELAQILLKNKGVTGLAVGFLFGAKTQV